MQERGGSKMKGWRGRWGIDATGGGAGEGLQQDEGVEGKVGN